MNHRAAPALSGPPASDEWPLPSRFLQTGGHTIHYVDTGQGPTILFVQTAAWSLIRRDVITQLRPSFRCVALDFPGTGAAAPSRAACSASMTASARRRHMTFHSPRWGGY